MAFKPSYKPSLFGQIWFPAALVGLLLLTLPGMVLFCLHLFGGDTELNEWLEDTFQLSYHFPLHWSLALLLLLIPPAILLLYFLRLKRKALQVPSTFLWRKSIEDLHVNSLFQWLRQNVLLLLQVLTVLALIYAVMGFRFHGNTTRGTHYILIIDNSASMAARDVKPSRLEWAKAEALKVIDANSDDNVGMVIAFNSKAATLQAYTSDRTKLRDAVMSIPQTNHTTRIDDALSLADSLANQIRSTEDVASQPEGPVEPGKERTFVPPKGIPTEVYLFSDGGFPELSESSLNKLNSLLAGNTSALGNLKLHFQVAGVVGPEHVNNIGILAFNVVRLDRDNPKRKDPNALKLQAFVQVRNYRAKKPDEQKEAEEVKLVLEVESGGQRVHSGQQTLSVPWRRIKVQEGKDKIVKDEPGDAQAMFDLPQLDLRSNTVLKVYLKDVGDDFDKDDVAWVVVGMVRKAKVLIVSPGNPVLDAFFQQEATKKVATIHQLAPSELDKETYLTAARSGDYDLVIFDRCIPGKEDDMPSANTMCIDRPPPPWERGAKALKNPYLIVSKKDHPLLRHLTTLWDVGISEAFRFHLKDSLSAAGKAVYLDGEQKAKKQLPAMTRLLEAAGDQPVLFTLPRGSFTDLVLTFPLIDDKGDLATNWPLQPSFPLFLRNVLYVLGNVTEADRERTVQPGEPMVLRPEADIKTLTITPPKGPAEKLQRGTRPEFIFTATDELGLYKVEREDGVVRHFAVNLLDPNESNIEPRTEIKIGNDEVSAGQERRQPREMWKWIALVALMLLLVEWYIYNRRIYV
jgi:hypothetical protein